MFVHISEKPHATQVVVISMGELKADPAKGHFSFVLLTG